MATGSVGRRVPPPEFVARLRALISHDTIHGAQSDDTAPPPRRVGPETVFSSTDAVLLSVALDLEATGVPRLAIGQIVAPLRGAISGLIRTPCDGNDPMVLVVTLPGHSNYAEGKPQHRAELTRSSNIVRVLAETPSTKAIVLPVAWIAAEILQTLPEAPIVRRGRN